MARPSILINHCRPDIQKDEKNDAASFAAYHHQRQHEEEQSIHLQEIHLQIIGNEFVLLILACCSECLNCRPSN